MSETKKKRSGVAKLLMILVCILLVASGMCGLQMYLLNNGSQLGNTLPVIFAALGLVEMIVIALTFFAIVVLLVYWGVTALVGKKPSDGGNG